MPRPPLPHVVVSLPILFFKEKRTFIAYTPALDLSASGTTLDRAKGNFQTVLRLFLEEITAAGTLDDVLQEMGWSKQERQWHPPVELQRIDRVPLKVPTAA